jgi:hypothetical protein
MSSQELVKRDAEEIAQTGNVLEVLARLSTDPRVDVEKVERIMGMLERQQAEQARRSFMAAMARVTPKLPEIKQHGTVKFEGKNGAQGQDRKFARLEDIDRAIRPIIAEEGFSQSFNTAAPEGGKIRVILRVSHKDGHFEILQIDLPHDSSGSKNGAQAVASTIAYGRRILTKMYWNLMEAGEDTDGNDPSTITEDQAKEINTLLVDTKSDKEKFLKRIAGVGSIEEIPAKDYDRIMETLEAKKQGMPK